jgi:alkylation response protein AidB-like acyl-CoA dehydrogenase
MSISDVTADLQLGTLVREIRGRRDEIEQGRRLPPELVAEMKGTGLFSLTVPRALGGREASPREILRTIETLAAADGSAGWCGMVGLGNNVAAGYMSEAGGREVFADPNAPSAGIAAPAGTAVRVDGGLQVDGRWAFASGITHSDWVWAGCVITEQGRPRMTANGPEIVHVCMPVSDVTIHDTWHTSGLCGTGSHDFSVSGVLVPERRAFGLLDPAGHRSEPLYQMPPLTLFVFQLAAVALGIARAALDELLEIADARVPTLYREPLAERPAAQIDVARAEAALGGARAFLFETVEAMWESVRAGKTPSLRELAIGRAAATQAVETGAAVARTANVLGGGSSIYRSSSLQRHARDAEAVTHHFTVAPHTWEEAGRVLLKRAPNVPVL